MNTPIVVLGAFGRMGREVIELAIESRDFLLHGAITRQEDKRRAPEHWPVAVMDDLDAAMLGYEGARAPVIIDFSVAGELRSHLTKAQRYGAGVVVATTGHVDADRQAMDEASAAIPLVLAPNTSLYANLMAFLCRITARAAKGSDAGILDIHHAHKRDAPSGTALMLKGAIEGADGQRSISISSLRLGEVVGEHTAFFLSESERLEITHRVTDRRAFAQGALLAAQFLYQQKPGLYDMSDVLNINQ